MSLDPLFLTAAGNIVSRIIDRAISNGWQRLDKKKVEKIIEDYLEERRLHVQPAAIEREIIIVLTGAGVIDPGGQLRLPSPRDRTLPEKLLKPVWERVYKIVSVATEKALDVPKNMTDNGILIQQWDDWGGTNQYWRLIPVSGHDGLFKIHSQHSAKVLDVPINQMANGIRIQQWSYGRGMNQHWRVEPTDSTGEIFKILSAQSGKALDVPKDMTNNGVKIQQWDYWGGTNQQWQLMRVK